MTQAEKDAVWCEWLVETDDASFGWLHWAGQITDAEYAACAAVPPKYNTTSFWEPQRGLKPHPLLAHPSLPPGRYSPGEIYLADKAYARANPINF